MRKESRVIVDILDKRDRKRTVIIVIKYFDFSKVACFFLFNQTKFACRKFFDSLIRHVVVVFSYLQFLLHFSELLLQS